MSRHEKVVSYDVLRVITTLLVVISHARYYALITPYGGCDYSALVDPTNGMWKLLTFVTEFINTITMPTFMALGGALFANSMRRGRFPTLGSLATDKAKRLLIPFFVVGLLYSFPLKLATGYFEGSGSILRDLLLGQLLLQGNTHLWFLPAMFMVFLILYVLERWIPVPKLVKLGVMAALSVVIWNYRIHLVAYPLRNLVWFYGGYCFEEVRHQWDPAPGAVWGIAGAVLTGVVYVALRRLRVMSGVLYLLGVRLLVPAMAVCSLYALSCWLGRGRLPATRGFRRLSRNAFGIYLYSDPVNYVILYLGSACCGSFLFAHDVGIALLYLMRIVITLVCSVLISELLRRCKVRYIV